MEIQCPTCSAKFKVPDTVSVATCPYCGTTFHIHTKETGEHFFFPLSRKDAGGALLKFLSRQYGAPADITGAKIKKKELHWVPVHFFYLHGRSKRWPTVEEVMFIGIPAGSPFQNLLMGYPFPIRGKRFFDEAAVSRGKYHEPEIPKEKAEEIARQTLLSALEGEARQEDKRLGEVDMEVKYQGLVHYPVWEIEYEYGGDSFRGYVDGSDNRVISAEYPLMSDARKKAAAVGAMLAGIGALIGIFAASMGGAGSFVGAIIPGAVGAFVIMKKGAVKRRWVSEVMKGGRGNVYFQPI